MVTLDVAFRAHLQLRVQVDARTQVRIRLGRVAQRVLPCQLLQSLGRLVSDLGRSVGLVLLNQLNGWVL